MSDIDKMADIEIYTGHFGSGKTEIVLNRAVELARQGEKVYVVDLDIAKPYFRTREVGEFLLNSGVELISPQEQLGDSDLPIITPKVLGAIQSAQGKLLFDVGGDDIGATALGFFADILQQRNSQVLMVLNPFRPFTQDLNAVKRMISEIEKAAHLTISGIVSNPNLGGETTLEDLKKGYLMVDEMARDLELPVILTAVTEQYAEALKPQLPEPSMKVSKYLLLPWELTEGQVFKINPKYKLFGGNKENDFGGVK